MAQTLLNLLQNYRSLPGYSLAIPKRIIHLLGIVSEAGISLPDLKLYLSLLKERTDLSLSLLQALKVMIREDNGISKATISSYFDFGGEGAGLFVRSSNNNVAQSAYNFSANANQFPFLKEFQMCTWFRIENFESQSTSSPHSGKGIPAPNSNDKLQRSRNPFPDLTGSVQVY